MNSKRFGLILSGLALTSACATSIYAQEAGPGAKAATNAVNSLSILSTLEAKEDLGLKPEQLVELDKLRQDHLAASSEKMRSLQGVRGAELREKAEPIWRQLAADVNKRLAEILDPDQLKRLQQIMLQMRGYSAFLEPEVQGALDFSEEQKDKLAAIREAFVEETREILAASKDDRRAANMKITELREKASADALSLLTEDQKKRWSDLVGKEFKRPVPGDAPRRPSTP